LAVLTVSAAHELSKKFGICVFFSWLSADLGMFSRKKAVKVPRQ